MKHSKLISILLLAFVAFFTPPPSAHASVPEDCIIAQAESQIGVREATGKNDGVAVENYLKATGLDKGFAWCAAFVVWNYQQCNVPITASAWSPALFPKSKTKYHIGIFRRVNIRPSDVFGIHFKSKNRIAHVGLVYKWPSGSHFFSIEGNTNEAGSREGDGVFVKRRLKSQINKISRWTC